MQKKTDHEPFTFDPTRAANLLLLMASPVRIEVLRRITVREWDVNALAEDLSMSQSALSQHLTKLRAAKLVTTRRAARQIFYSSKSTAVSAILATLEHLGPIHAGTLSDAREAARRQLIAARSSAARMA